MHFKLAIIGAIPSGMNVLAAECRGWSTCNSGVSSRNQLYQARQHVCGDTDLYKNDGEWHASGGGGVKWPGGNSQQICWDAFENILNQCRPEGTGTKNHSGSWN
ncbi:hypothetical protein EKO04_011555 [Ascochyta lentis]|uniref:Uncharacterized protein n=1 Tax=Ascochyta lentis TaxID=205686 RepID=A0A8H7ITY9_9PLEO|nr:hypothetical protein EKO04_011555 [Ascochyta lentis]